MDRAQVHARGEPDDSGSTIPQQLVKTMFLTPDQTAVRKGVEAVLAQEMAYLVFDARIIEPYTDYAQFSPEGYGVCAARLVLLRPLEQGDVPGPGRPARRPAPLTAARATRPGPPAWFEQMGGFTATEALGIDGLAADEPAGDGDCSEMPEDVAALIAREQGR